MRESGFNAFCGGEFWNSSLLLENTWPELTDCFTSTVLTWIPCALVWLLLPYFLYDVHNPDSENNPGLDFLRVRKKNHTGQHGGVKVSKVFKRLENGNGNHVLKSDDNLHSTEEEWNKPYMSIVCGCKIILSCILAVLSILLCVSYVEKHEPKSKILGSVIYVCTYALVATQLWYERRLGRYPSFIPFYFYGLTMFLDVIPIYTWALTDAHKEAIGTFSLLVGDFVFNTVCLALTFVPDAIYPPGRKGYKNMDKPENKECPEAYSPYPWKLFFLWMLRLILDGFRREITVEDIWNLHPRDKGKRINAIFESQWIQEQENVERRNAKNFPELYTSERLYTNGTHPKKPRKRKDGQRSSMVKYNLTEKSSLITMDEGRVSVGASMEPFSTEKKLEKANLFWVLLKWQWWAVIAALLQKLCADLSMFIGPNILGYLIQRLENPEPEKIWQAYALSISLIIFGMIKSVLFAQSFIRCVRMGLQIKTVLIASIYKKALMVASYAKKGTTVGEIVNLMSVDCQRLQEILGVYIFMATMPFQVTVALIFLWNQLGSSILTGVFLLFVTIPFNSYLVAKQKRLQEESLKLKDKRIKLVNEVLSGMKVLKLYAWEDEFRRKVAAIRSQEIRIQYKIASIYAVSGVLWSFAPFLVGFVSFATYILSDPNNVLDAEKAFVSLALFSLLRVPMTYVSTLMTFTVQVFVSIKRISAFLLFEDLDETNVEMDDTAEHAISIKNGSFTWDRDMEPLFKRINVNIQSGQLTAIVGPVGCGKSSLISAFLGEMEKLRGEVVVKSQMAYVSQQAWIQNATVRDNILFGSKYNKRRYQQIVKACELERDFTILEAGDLTEIGEKGINLSGGQKQRVNLARAVYSDSDIYLFDDPLSAVDAHVGKAIFQNVMSREGLLSKKTRVLVTHGVHWLPMVDNILVLSNANISERGTYEELISRKGPFAQFVHEHLVSEMLGNTTDVDEPEDGDGTTVSDDEELLQVRMGMLSSLEKLNDIVSSGDELAISRESLRQRKIRRRTKQRRISESVKVPETTEYTTSVVSVHPEEGKLILQEKLESGNVKWDIFSTYARAAGLWAMIFALVNFTANQALLTASSFFLTEWTEDSLLLNASTRTTPEGKGRRDYYLWIYGGVYGGAQLITFIVFFYLFWYRMTRASERLHELLLERLFHAPMSFFDQTPIGRILNRFSKDVDTVDNTLPLILRDWLITGAMIVIILIVVLIQTPIFGAVLVPILAVFMVIQNYYVKTSRQLKRIEAITRSPIYSHFSESITGAAVIRAYGAKERFIDASEKMVDKNQVYFYASQGAIRWLQINMDLLANLVVFFAAVFQITSGGGGSGAGLSVSYALQISTGLTYMVRQICEFETNIVSVERLKEYSLVDQEAPPINPNDRPPKDWPKVGDVIFHNFQVRYREGLDLVLKGVTCKIKGGEKIGIVGRTGAGKSSLTVALFRIIEAANGSIVVDGINIADIGLHDLRSKLTILPQDPVLFSGTLRMNIDPFDEYTDDQLWTALERAHLKNFVVGQPEKLMYECGEEGTNLSVGQRQLVCLARALLRHTKILILDEATAAIDMETDGLIQNTIREDFSNCTILAIAHRLNTIMDYDKVIVMDAGVIVEFDSPSRLLQQQGVFYGMCKDAGLAQ